MILPERITFGDRYLLTAGNVLSELRENCLGVENLALLGSGGPDDDTDPGHLAARFLARFAREVVDAVDEVAMYCERGDRDIEMLKAKMREQVVNR